MCDMFGRRKHSHQQEDGIVGMAVMEEKLTREQMEAIDALCRAFGIRHTARTGYPITIRAYNGEWIEVEAGGRRYLRKHQDI